MPKMTKIICTLGPASDTLEKMEQLGADICKVAVMPHTPEDVLTLLSATEERARVSGVPLITMAMGPLGTVSRVCGELVGSCLTFGTLGAASAPGQLPAQQLAEMLELLCPHRREVQR